MLVPSQDFSLLRGVTSISGGLVTALHHQSVFLIAIQLSVHGFGHQVELIVGSRKFEGLTIFVFQSDDIFIT